MILGGLKVKFYLCCPPIAWFLLVSNDVCWFILFLTPLVCVFEFELVFLFVFVSLNLAVNCQWVMFHVLELSFLQSHLCLCLSLCICLFQFQFIGHCQYSKSWSSLYRNNRGAATRALEPLPAGAEADFVLNRPPMPHRYFQALFNRSRNSQNWRKLCTLSMNKHCLVPTRLIFLLLSSCYAPANI